MRCPTCGHENNNLATRCSACGSALVAPTQTPAEDSGETIPMATPEPSADVSVGRDGTAKRASVLAESPEPNGEDPQLREVIGAAGRIVSTKRNKVGAFFHAHQKAVGISLALGVVVIMGVVWLVLNVSNVPTYAQIEEDLSALAPQYEYEGGTFGPDLTIPLSSIVVTGRATAQTPAGTETSPGVGPASFDVQAEITYDDGQICVVRDVGATYLRAEDGWTINGELAEQGISFSARSGVDEQKVLANMPAILSAADTADTSLADIYAQGTFAIVGNDFEEAPNMDTATDDVVIRCTSQDGFSSYEGNVTARFGFESGEWRLRETEADARAAVRTFDPLLGSWSGTLVSHEGDGGSCYGAQDHALTITIDSLGDASGSGTTVQGTISCVAHYHERLESDEAADEGDELMERVPYTGALSSERDRATGSTLNLEGATAGNPLGDVSFVVNFGTEDDPSAVVARVTTTHSYEELLLFVLPHQTTARFTDTYLLSHT